jgi:hypothetical protein
MSGDVNTADSRLSPKAIRHGIVARPIKNTPIVKGDDQDEVYL